jgi:DnaK suppressor protein
MDRKVLKKKMSMNKDFCEMIRLRLVAERVEIVAKLNAAKDKSPDCDGDDIDLAAGRLLMSVDSQLSKIDAGKLRQIDTALAKIKAGTFGVCCECDESIGQKRVEFNPSFSKCVLCAENDEHHAKNHRQR